ncbi:MAG TPA: AAA domain-containing protein [Nitrospira sp.]|nr:AAA domain-containing protein [Nitrospira sp.]
MLFVSEKLAALEVVRKRLDEAGLGTFCLELHSHKTQKKEFLRDLDRRLKLKLSPPEALDGRLTSLRKVRDELTEYAKLISSEFGSLSLTVFRLIWLRERLLNSLPRTAPSAAFPMLNDVQSMTRSDLDALKLHAKAFNIALNGVLQDWASVPNHPWYGVTRLDIGAYEERNVVQSVSELHMSARNLSRFGKESSLATGLAPEVLLPSLSSLDQLCQSIKLRQTELLDILPVLSSVANQHTIRDFAELLKTFRAEEALLCSKFLGFTPARTWNKEKVTKACSDALAHNWGSTLAELSQYAEKVEGAIYKLESSWRTHDAIMNRVRCDVPFGTHSVSAITSLLVLTESAPCEVLHLYHAGLSQETASYIVKKASYQASILKETMAALDAWFDINSLPSLEDLIVFRDVLVESNWLTRILSSSCRKALNSYRRLLKTREKRSIRQVVADLNHLIDFAKKKGAFERNQQFKQVFGEHFDSVYTDFDSFGRILEWKEKCLKVSASVHATYASTIDDLRDAAPSEVASIKFWLESQRPQIDELQRTVPELLELMGKSTVNGLCIEDFNATREYFLASLSECRCAIETLSPLKVGPTEPLQNIPVLLNRAEELLLLRERIQEHSASDILGRHFNGTGTDLHRITTTIDLAEIISGQSFHQAIEEWLFVPSLPERLVQIRSIVNQGLPLLLSYEEASTSFRSIVCLDEKQWYGNTPPTLEKVVERAEVALSNTESLTEWIYYLRCRHELDARRLLPLVELAESQCLPPAHLEDAVSFCVMNSLVEKCFENYPSLRRFAGMTHNQVRKRFAELDSEVIEGYRARIAHSLATAPIPPGITGGLASTLTDRALIEREIEKERKHIPIRQLIKRAGRALQAMKPCFMMGPLSVAQYLPPGELAFDLVIMDEASQLKPESAIGAIARGQQVVIVGDPKQLPPTTFFQRYMNDDIEEENEEDDPLASESESILELASTIYRPNRRLRWHYRSRHESLIAFSNSEFYGDLIVFPSPVAHSESLGVKYCVVPNGVFEHRHNYVEAQQIVQAAVKHMTVAPAESLGIVAMNSAQQALIHDLIEEQRKTNPYVQSYIEVRKNGLEPFFVKNLETVQGDERDVIFISFTYGRTSEGSLHQRFGPINGDSGHRRLNVLFTRAKRRTHVFTSIDPDDIRIEPSSKWGLRALKGYLEYAKTGILSSPQGSYGSPESDFELAVGQALKARGFEVVPQLGVAGYFIDIGILHPAHPGRYVLGVECDGATYHSARSARDRDRLREEVLSDLGWNIHRIWSTDWFRNSRKEIDRIEQRIKLILEKEQNGPAHERTTEPLQQPENRQSHKKLTIDEARQLLIDLREKEIRPEYPDADPSHGLLRKTMLDALLRQRPTSLEQFKAIIPAAMRSSTDSRHMKFLPKVFEILLQV